MSIVSLLTSALFAILATILSSYIYDKFIKNQIYTKLLKNPNGSDAQELVDLYGQLFPANGTNYTEDEIIEMITISPEEAIYKHVIARDIVIIAKHQNRVVGFIFCHFYPERKKAIISYYGIDHDSLKARQHAASKLLSRLHKILNHNFSSCEYLFFDLEGNTRPSRFKMNASNLGLRAYELNFNYYCPKISLDENSLEKKLTLMCIPLHGELPNKLPKTEVLDFLNFVLLDCYGDLYQSHDPRHEPYQHYLRGLLSKYATELPDHITTEWRTHRPNKTTHIPCA